MRDIVPTPDSTLQSRSTLRSNQALTSERILPRCATGLAESQMLKQSLPPATVAHQQVPRPQTALPMLEPEGALLTVHREIIGSDASGAGLFEHAGKEHWPQRKAFKGSPPGQREQWPLPQDPLKSVSAVPLTESIPMSQRKKLSASRVCTISDGLRSSLDEVLAQSDRATVDVNVVRTVPDLPMPAASEASKAVTQTITASEASEALEGAFEAKSTASTKVTASIMRANSNMGTANTAWHTANSTTYKPEGPRQSSGISPEPLDTLPRYRELIRQSNTGGYKRASWPPYMAKQRIYPPQPALESFATVVKRTRGTSPPLPRMAGTGTATAAATSAVKRVSNARCRVAVSGAEPTTTSTAEGVYSSIERVGGLHPLILPSPLPPFEAGSPDSPVSPTPTDSAFDSRDEEYETPMTSPELSPTKLRPIKCRFPRLEVVLPQLDGSHGSVAEGDADDRSGEPSKPESHVHADSAARWSLQSVTDNERALSDSIPPATDSEPDNDGEELLEYDDETPLVPASPAKGATAFPFPGQSRSRVSFFSASNQRRPSALLKQYGSDASPRQRRLLTAGLRMPDRFVTGRPGTPTKEALILAQPVEKLSASEKRARPQLANVDPFAPAPRRSLRMAEQFATLRGPPALPRPVGRTSTLVGDAQAARQRAVSEGAVWHVGGTLVTEGVASTTNGRGGRVTSGTSAPHYTADFLRKTSASEDEVKHGRRLALAMDIDQSARMLGLSPPSSTSSPSSASTSPKGRSWRNNGWEQDGPITPTKVRAKKAKDIPIIPFRVLDAPALRDDYYCSLLSYSPTMQCLAVGLGPHVYLWSETRGAANKNIPDSLTAPFASHVTSIAFSSQEGGSAILAIGRADGRITLWSPLDRDPRFDSEQPAPVSCVCFRPNTVRRQSIREPTTTVATEELLVGDEAGNVYFYSIEWPDQHQRDLFDWHGSMTLLARISCHSQQVCGMAWNPDGEFFASGGNDNQLFLFETRKILRPSTTRARGHSDATVNVRSGSSGSSSTVAGQGAVLNIIPGQHKHVFALNAAVKAIAFAPWQPSLLATGGGSNDRCIHFFHALSGASLATIDCHAQVTSLTWSEKRREIAATFGFAQPEHPFRVAVFAWPSCRMVVGIPWWSEERALYAVAYPRGPSGGLDRRDRDRVDAEGRPWYGRRTREEGCLVIATSDASIKFHEIWAEPGEGAKRSPPGGLLAGSQILEGECSLEMERGGIIR